MRASRIRAGAVTYFAVQALSIPAWWILIAQLESVRRVFFLDAEVPTYFRAFAVPDLVVVGAGSAVAAWLLARGTPSWRSVALLVLGGLVYATLFTISWTMSGMAPLAPSALMGAATVATAIALAITPTDAGPGI